MGIKTFNFTSYIEYSTFLSNIQPLCTQAETQFSKGKTPALNAVVRACRGLCERLSAYKWVGGTPPYPIQYNPELKKIIQEITPLDRTLAQSFSKLGTEKEIVTRDDIPERCWTCGPKVFLPKRELYVSTGSAANFTTHVKKLLGTSTTPSNNSPPPPQPAPSSQGNNESLSSFVVFSLVALLAVGVVAMIRKADLFSQKKVEEKKPITTQEPPAAQPKRPSLI